MKDLPPTQQFRDTTSPLAKTIGGVTGQSPLVIENAARTAFGGVGSQLLGESPLKQLERRFGKAASGAQTDQTFQNIQTYQTNQALETQKRKDAINKVVTILTDPSVPRERKIQVATAIAKDKKVLSEVKQALVDKKENVTPADRAVRSLSIKQRASYIKDQLQPLSREEKRALVIEYIKKGILTKEVAKEIGKAQ